MATQARLEHKLQKLNGRYKALGKAHGRLCRSIDSILNEFTPRASLHPDIPPVIAALRRALAEGKRSHQPGAGLAAPLSAPEPGRRAALAPQSAPAFTSAQSAALKLARNAVALRAEQLAACRACGVEASAFQQALAELDRMLKPAPNR